MEAVTRCRSAQRRNNFAGRDPLEQVAGEVDRTGSAGTNSSGLQLY
jgi:hypothetical protein